MTFEKKNLSGTETTMTEKSRFYKAVVGYFNSIMKYLSNSPLDPFLR